MKYKLIYDDKADESLRKLPNYISNRITEKISETKDNPRRHFKKLKGRPEYKLRIGDYRVIADIIDNELIILVLYIDHRKRVYK